MQNQNRRLRPTSSKTRGKLGWSWLLSGWAGGHRFYLGHSAHGALLLLFTLATCGLGAVVGYVDGAILFFNRPKDAHGLPVVSAGKQIWADDVEVHALPPLHALVHLAFHLGVIFLLPFVVGAAAALFLRTNEVNDTAGLLEALGAVVLLPILAVHVTGVALKTREEAKLLRAAGSLSLRTVLDAAARSAAMLTGRGFAVLLTGLAFVVLALAYRWASLGVLAVVSLTAFYAATGASALVSAFLVRRFGSNALARGGRLHRRVVPGVVRVGETAHDTVDISSVPVPPGFFLLLEGEWPDRLDTRVRHVVPPRARDEVVTLSTPLRRTPRGAWQAPPLRVSFTDLLGLTKTSVASLATAKVKVLPAVRAAEIDRPPPSDVEEPDIVTRPHRFPTEDLFRFREYVPGDDTRRIHWKMSMKTGRLQVKKPDSKETTSKRVLLALDTHVPPSWLAHAAVLDEALDELVDGWLALAKKLGEDGHKVTLVLRARNDAGEHKTEVIAVDRANHALQLDAGARADWQCEAPIEAVLDEAAVTHPLDDFDSAVIVTMRLEPPRALRAEAKETTWVYLHPRDALGPMPPSPFEIWLDFDGRKRRGLAALARLFLLPHPAGSDDNGLRARLQHLEHRLEDRTHRVELRRAVEAAGDRAFAALLQSKDAVYRVEPSGGRHRLRGLKGVTKKRLLRPLGTSIHDEDTAPAKEVA